MLYSYKYPGQCHLVTLAILTIVFGLGIASFSSANDKTIETNQRACRFITDKLQKSYESFKDISATFVQQTIIPGDPEPVRASGRVFFKRPYLMRWDYETPERQLIVTSGSKVYVYEIEAKQVNVLSRKQFLSTKVSRAFFFGKGDIQRDFKVIGCTLTEDGWVLELQPREPIPQLKTLRLTIDKDRFLVKKTEIEDQMGSKTVIAFNDIRINANLGKKLFTFRIPKGVEVFNAN